MATTTPPRSAHPIEPPIRANSELHHTPQASPTILQRLQASPLRNIAWACRLSTSNTKTRLNTGAAMSSRPRTLAVAVWAARSTDSTIYTSTASLPLPIKAPTCPSHPSLLASSGSEAYRIRTVSVTRERPLSSSSSNPCPPSHHTPGSPNRLTLREPLPSSAPTR